MRTSVELDVETVNDLKQAESVTRERRATLLRQAIRAGLPLVVNRYQAPRPDGYFIEAYPRPKDRQTLRAAMAKIPQRRRA
jgi:cell division protein FtsX